MKLLALKLYIFQHGSTQIQLSFSFTVSQLAEYVFTVLIFVNVYQMQNSAHYEFSPSLCLNVQENLNINEAANFLVKHIIASENDILKSAVPDTISPQLTTNTKMSCSACFKP